MTLYEISGQYQKLLDMSEEIPPDALRDTLESLDGEYSEKVDGYCAVINQLKAEAGDLDEEIKRMSARRDSRKNRVKLMREKLAESMSATGHKNVRTPKFTVYLSRHTGKPQYDARTLIEWAEQNGHDDLVDYTVGINENAVMGIINWAEKNGRDDLLSYTTTVNEERLLEYMADHDDAPASIPVTERANIR